MSKEAPAPKQAAIYWRLLPQYTVPRGQDGLFHATKNGMVLEVTKPVHLEYDYPGFVAAWDANPGDVVLRIRQPADELEIHYAFVLTGIRITHVSVAERFSDPDALNTALRQTVRHIPKSLFGRSELIRGRRYRIPGAIDRAIDEARRNDIQGQYRGIIGRARELRRIQIKIETGFRNAYQTLVIGYRLLEAGQEPISRVARRVEGLWHYLVRVAAFNPYYEIVHSSDEVLALQKACETKEIDKFMRLIARAIPPLEKGWRGHRVRPLEIRGASRRVASVTEES